MILPLLFMAAAACVGVTPDSDKILARDLAPAIPAFSDLAPDTPVALAPVAGARRVFHTGELRQLALRLGLAPVDPIQGDVCVERKSAPLRPEDLLEAMRRVLPVAKIELLDFSRQPAPLGRVEFALRDHHPAPKGAFWRGGVRYAGSRRFVVWASVNLSVKELRVTAAEPLRPGQTLRPTQLRVEEVEVFPQPGKFLSTSEQVSGRVLRRAVEKGAAIQSEWLEPARDVLRGESVHVEAGAGAARLEFEGVAEAPGTAGQVIPVKNPQSQKRFFARVEGKGRVVVDGGVR
jgi:flagella basal body P-ring formation protein FlgA